MIQKERILCRPFTLKTDYSKWSAAPKLPHSIARVCSSIDYWWYLFSIAEAAGYTPIWSQGRRLLYTSDDQLTRTLTTWYTNLKKLSSQSLWIITTGSVVRFFWLTICDIQLPVVLYRLMLGVLTHGSMIVNVESWRAQFYRFSRICNQYNTMQVKLG